MSKRSQRVRSRSDVLDLEEAADRISWASAAMPNVAALLTIPDGTVVRATEEAAALAGEPSASALLGRNLADLLEPAGGIAQLRGRGGTIPVRPMSWPHHEDGKLLVTVLSDVSDLVWRHERLQLHRDHGPTAGRRPVAVGSWTFTIDTGELYCCPTLRSLLTLNGPTPDLGSVLDALHPRDRGLARAFAADLEAMTDDRVIHVELRDSSGEHVYQCTGHAEFGPCGKAARLHGIVQDITELRSLESQLQDERRRFHDAQRVAQLGTWELDPDTYELRLSDTLHEISGTRAGVPWTLDGYFAAVHPDDRQRVRAAWCELVRNHTTLEIDHRYVRRDGVIRDFRLHGKAVARSDREVAFVGTTQDVTEYRAALTRMERSSQRFTDLVTIAPVGIGLFDQAECLVDANEALCDLLGYPLDQLRGMAVRRMTDPGEKAVSLRAVADSTASVIGRSRAQQTLIRSDGESVYCELHVAPSVQDDGTHFWLVVFQDVTERRRAADALHYQATHDDLTGLPNRAAVNKMLESLLSRADRSDVAVLFCDIDNFKRVNDSLGHDAGDELLVALARRLEGGLPHECTIGRLSGDEFVILCSDVAVVGGVDSLATKVAGLLRTAAPVHGQLVRVSASIGVAVPNGEGVGGEDLLRFADAAMFEAKGRGSGKVSLASPALIASADRQMQLEGQLREALAGDGLVLHYQPVVSADGSVITAEALVRWEHPERGLLRPDAFLPVAEQGDLLPELDRWVLRTALREAAQWPHSAGKKVAVAVNLAGLVPGSPDFVDAVVDLVAESGIEWDRVILELVETALVDLPSRCLQAMRQLVARGVRFAVDDFGTGYSSLARLKDLPAQIIKVDRRFVSGVGGDASDFAVARAVVDMARAMGRQCVAEGVETPIQFHVLSGVGVDAYQGWLFSGAVPPEEFRTMLSLGPLHAPRGL